MCDVQPPEGGPSRYGGHTQALGCLGSSWVSVLGPGVEHCASLHQPPEGPTPNCKVGSSVTALQGPRSQNHRFNCCQPGSVSQALMSYETSQEAKAQEGSRQIKSQRRVQGWGMGG